ncbi:AsnC family transcriptional regulator [Candidatus Acidianus copahuensis]|uniref:AsnC family transcriptional regulator n=1 Tax=Candidatus Acidianus copahuensis TaxID=1160895 RepID=A0A031LUG7_9CREN|nr:winged helix-turn-helix transcriptional regulator [Candidatus Acidianus copahuensis]EZQ11089.1 AsnC family transcriptional regulator [Candidatus Acidianus copahuensis]
MDKINNMILFYLLKDFKASQRSIATRIGISSPAVNYRVNKLFSEGIIRKVSLYINPNFYGKYHGYVSFKNTKDWKGEYIFKVNCLEKTNIYEIEARTLEELNSKFKVMSDVMGEPAMMYIPSQIPLNPSSFDIKLVSLLKEDPQRDASEIADLMKVSTKTVRRHLRYLEGKGLIRLVPIIDIAKAEMFMFAIFTRNIEMGKKFFSSTSFRQITDEKAGIFVNIAENFLDIKDRYFKFREFDEDADLMIALSYDFS